MNATATVNRNSHTGTRCAWTAVLVMVALLIVPETILAQRSLEPYSATSELEAAVAALEDAVATLQAENATLRGTVYKLQSRVNENTAAVGTVQNKLVHFSRVGNEVFIDGANLHVRNGLGATEQPGVNALGNIVIGYNTSRGRPCNVGENPHASIGCDRRSGSHMLVVGRELNYTASGGIVAGLRNTTVGDYASVTGGYNNFAEAVYSSVTGGRTNTASAAYSSVTGGYYNRARGRFSSITGGTENWTNAYYSSVTGGRYNSTEEWYSSITGGLWNVTSGYYSSVTGGDHNEANGNFQNLP